MRDTKLFEITVDNMTEANDLKNKLSELKIKEVEDGIEMTYSGFISCDITQKDDEVELTTYTYLNQEEFEDIVFECCNAPKFFQYDKRDMK